MNKRRREELREDLAVLCHEMWAAQMRSLWRFVEQGERGEDILVLPARARLLHLMHQPFSAQNEDDKRGDRQEADRILAVLDKHRATRSAQGSQEGRHGAHNSKIGGSSPPPAPR